MLRGGMQEAETGKGVEWLEKVTDAPFTAARGRDHLRPIGIRISSTTSD
jgi:hypothetical protein